MKYIRFSVVLGILSLFSATMFTSCRHGSPTGPTDTTTASDSCCHGRITLTVYDSATGHVLDGGAASLYDGDHLVSAKPMRDSGTVWDGLCPGNYHFALSKDGYHSTEFAIDSMGCSATREVNDTMVSGTVTSSDSCCDGHDSITVADSSTHDPLSGVNVVLTNRTTGMTRTARTIAGGVAFYHLCPGSYLCTIGKDGYAPITFDWHQGCDTALTFTKSLLAYHHSDSCCGGVVELTVKDSATGHAISGAEVVLYYNGTELRSVLTGDDGGARFDGLCVGNYRITIDHDDYPQGVVEFYEHCDLTHSFTKSLLAATTPHECDTASISLHVMDSLHQDMNISGATVTIRIDGHHDNFATGTTDSDGYFFSEHNLPGHTTYIVTISKDGYTTKSFSVQVGDCELYGRLVYLSPQ